MLHRALRELVSEYGASVFQSADVLRGALDDYFDEGAISTGEANLLTDALRLGGLTSVATLLDGGASPEQAVEEAATRVARDRGGADVPAARWAIAMLGFAVGRLPESLVIGLSPISPTASEPTVTAPGVPIAGDGRRPSAPTAPAAPALTPAAAPTEARPDAPGPTDTPVRRRGPAVSIALIALAAAAAAAIAVIGWWMSSDDRDRDPSAFASETAQTPGVSQKDEPTGATTPTSEASEPEPEKEKDRGRAPTYVCWDGTDSKKLSTCGSPTGAAGAGWLFPQSAEQDCTSTTAGDRPFHLECTVEAPSGAKAYIKYSEWKTWDEAWDHYSGEPGVEGGLQDWLGLHLWLSRSGTEPCCSYKAAVLYPGVPWSATIYAASDSARERLLHRMDFRKPGTLAGERAGSIPR